MANQTPWFCPEDGTRNTGNYCSHCGRQRPKYPASANPPPRSGHSFLRTALIVFVVFLASYGIGHSVASRSSDSPKETSTPTSAATPETRAPATEPATKPVTNYDTSSVTNYNWSWINATIRDGSSTLSISAAGFTQTLRNVKSFTVYMDVEMNANTSCKDWQVWIRRNGSFEKAAKIYLPNGNGEVTQTVTFSSPATFDAIAITPTIPGGYSWSMALGFSDFRSA